MRTSCPLSCSGGWGNSWTVNWIPHGFRGMPWGHLGAGDNLGSQGIPCGLGILGSLGPSPRIPGGGAGAELSRHSGTLIDDPRVSPPVAPPVPAVAMAAQGCRRAFGAKASTVNPLLRLTSGDCRAARSFLCAKSTLDGLLGMVSMLLVLALGTQYVCGVVVHPRWRGSTPVW